MLTCANCGAENPADSRFCNACGTALDALEPERESRKVVTILFCDLVGSTTLGESTDPEALRTRMRRYFEDLRAILERHGGTVVSPRSSVPHGQHRTGSRVRVLRSHSPPTQFPGGAGRRRSARHSGRRPRAEFEAEGDDIGLAEYWLAVGWEAWARARGVETASACEKALEHSTGQPPRSRASVARPASFCSERICTRRCRSMPQRIKDRSLMPCSALSRGDSSP